MTDGLLATLSVDAMLSTLLGSQLVSRPLNQDRTFLSLNRRGEKEESNGGTDGMLICVATCSAAAALSSLSPTVNRANKHGSWIFKILGTPFCTQIFCLLFRNNECHSTYGCSTEVPSRRRRARGGQGRARGDRAGRVPRPRDRPSHNTQRMLPPRRTRNVSTTWFHSCCLSFLAPSEMFSLRRLTGNCRGSKDSFAAAPAAKTAAAVTVRRKGEGG